MNLSMLFFTGEGCAACSAMKPSLRQLQEEGADIQILDVVEHQHEAAMYRVRSLPTIIVLKDGDFYNQAIGAQSMSTLRSLLGL